jgi:type I restriction enzyme S subunit
LARAANEDEWGVLKVGAVSFGQFDQRENKALPGGLGFNAAHEVRNGDFLVCRANTAELVGACAIIPSTRPKLLLSDKTFRFHFLPDAEIIPEWLDHTLKSPALRAQIERAASGTSPTMKNISKEKVMSLLMPPHSRSRQVQVVAELGRLDRGVGTMKRLQGATAAELDAMLPAILDLAFRGDL